VVEVNPASLENKVIGVSAVNGDYYRESSVLLWSGWSVWECFAQECCTLGLQTDTIH